MKPLTKEFLLSRGYCCGNNCTNCPYYPKAKIGSTQVFKPPEKVNCSPSCSLKTMQEGLCICYMEAVIER
jgi:hypothetical protein